MYVKEITYTDYDDVQRTEKFYFNLSKADFLRLEMEFDEGFADHAKKVVDSGNKKETFAMFEMLISMSYGIKDKTSNKFIKTKDALNEFLASEAYGELLSELFSNASTLVEFFDGIMPREMRGKMKENKNEILDNVPAELKDQVAEVLA